MICIYAKLPQSETLKLRAKANTWVFFSCHPTSLFHKLVEFTIQPDQDYNLRGHMHERDHGLAPC